jgi:hypothetical protein
MEIPPIGFLHKTAYRRKKRWSIDAGTQCADESSITLAMATMRKALSAIAEMNCTIRSR